MYNDDNKSTTKHTLHKWFNVNVRSERVFVQTQCDSMWAAVTATTLALIATQWRTLPCELLIYRCAVVPHCSCCYFISITMFIALEIHVCVCMCTSDWMCFILSHHLAHALRLISILTLYGDTIWYLWRKCSISKTHPKNKQTSISIIMCMFSSSNIFFIQIKRKIKQKINECIVCLFLWLRYTKIWSPFFFAQFKAILKCLAFSGYGCFFFFFICVTFVYMNTNSHVWYALKCVVLLAIACLSTLTFVFFLSHFNIHFNSIFALSFV